MKVTSVFDTKCNEELNILIGQNAQENWDIIDMANQYDYWFHLADKPSCHVILQLPSKKSDINKQSLIHCAALCKENSKYATQKNIEVIYTERKNITKGDVAGSVLTKKTKIIRI
jgi:predicted ribosome quality control (RQC) complex YloA/Tae2 family protein